MRYLFLICGLLFSQLLVAQVRFEARTAAREVVKDGYFNVSFTLYNAESNQFRAPDFGTFQKVNGPSVSSSSNTQIINGQVSQSSEKSFVFTVSATKLGQQTIGSASIIVDGKKYRTKPLTINVVQGKEIKEEDVFVRTIVDSTAFYAGQQIVVDYKLYFSIDLASYKLFKESDYAGFGASRVDNFDSSIRPEYYNGKQYSTKTIRRIALFPQQPGDYAISPLGVQVTIAAGQSNSNRGSRMVRNLQSNPVAITVSPLPSDAPVSFSGAIGEFEPSFSVNKSTLSTDDAIDLTLSVYGNGDVKRLQAPNLNINDKDFDVYDPVLIDERSGEGAGQVRNRKVFQYTLTPKRAGNLLLAPEFSYFSLDSNDYVTVRRSIQLQVSQGKNTQTAEDDINKVAEESDIRDIHMQTSLSDSQPWLIGSWLYKILLILPFVGLAGLMLYKFKQQQEGDVDQELLKSQQATKVALQKLSQAKTYMEANNPRAFYDEVSRAALGYVSDKLKIPGSQMSKSNVAEKLSSLGVSATNIDAFVGLLKTCEMALFAGQANATAMQENFDQAKTVISDIEQEL